MSFDEWKQRVPETDTCEGDSEICECPECRKWRDNREPREVTFDEALGNITGERERLDEARRLKS